MALSDAGGSWGFQLKCAKHWLRPEAGERTEQASKNAFRRQKNQTTLRVRRGMQSYRPHRNAIKGSSHLVGPRYGWSSFVNGCAFDRLAHTVIALLSIAAAAFVIWQTFHFGVLWDFSFLIDNAYRIARGDIPYRDYPLAWAPGTFFVQAVLISVFGRSYAVHETYCALINAASLWITWQILRVVHARDAAARDWRAALWCFPLIPLGVYSIYFHPWYDSDCIFAALIGLLGLCRLATRRRSSQLGAFLFGISWAAPVLIKQNIGLPVLFCFLGCGALGSLGFFAPSVRKGFIAALSGTAVALAGVFMILHLSVGVDTYFYWTFEHAWKVRGGDVWMPLRIIWHTPPAVAALSMVALGWVVLLTSSGQWSVWRWLGISLLVIPLMPPLFL